MSEEKEKAVPRNISLYPSDWAVVQEVGKPAGMSTSQAVRTIIRDWVRMKETYDGHRHPILDVDQRN